MRRIKTRFWSEYPLVLLSEQFTDIWEGCFTPEEIDASWDAPLSENEATHASAIIDADNYHYIQLIDNSFNVVGFSYAPSGVFKFEFDDRIYLLQTYGYYGDSFTKKDIKQFIYSEDLEKCLVQESEYWTEDSTHFLFNALYLWKEAEDVIKIELGKKNLIQTYELNKGNFKLFENDYHFLHVISKF